MILKEMATTVTPNPGHQQTHSVQLHQQAGGSSGHYCKDCGVMFESSTSLEVHLSYHKENLLTRWANQESMEKSNHRATQDIPPPHTENGGNNYFQPGQGGEAQQGHFAPLQYNNNTGDHHVDPPMSYRNSFHPTPPVDPHGGPPHHLYGVPHGSHIFSPGSRNANRPGNGANPAESPAEILDLDSHKVHIYQQQQAAERANANFFHRPYLPHLLPPPLLQLQNPSGNNGWHAPPDFVPPTPNGPGFPGDHHPSYPNPPPNGPNIVYDIVRPDSGNYPPQETSAQAPPGHLSFPPEQFNGIRGVYDSDEAPARPSPRPNVKSPKRSPAAPKGSNATPGKGKGWKGGECKRPKTYNCQACNKWFTSSGHLKRHYGTTLHKNSIRQKGEMAEEIPSKPGKRSPPESKKGGGSGGNGTDSMDSSEPTSSPPLRESGNKSEESISGKSTPIYMPPSAGSRENNFLPGHPARSPSNGPSFAMGLPGGQSYHPPISSAYGANTPPASGIAQQYIQTHHIQHQQSGGQQQQFHHFSAHPPHPFSNGFPPEAMGNSSPFTTASSVPTTVYSSVPYTMEGSSLPPFSTVGFSHYDPNAFHGGPPGGGANFPGNNGGPPQSNFGSSGREEQRGSPSSQGGFDRPYESVKVEQDSPEEARSGSVSHSLAGSFVEDETDMSGTEISGSSEGEGSPNHHNYSEDFPEEDQRVVFKCSSCSKTFGRSCYLTQHANSSHSAASKPFKCQMCGKKFPEAPALSDHVAKHGSDKPYKCDLCPKQFNHKTDLRRHLCLHTGEKPYICQDCGRGFIRKDHMAKHRATHNKKKSPA